MKAPQGSQTFAKTIALLNHIAERQNAPTLQDLLAETSHTRPTLYRLLASLEAEGMIKLNDDKTYVVGLRLLTLARGALFNLDIRDIAKPYLEKLRNETEETVHLAVRSGNSLVYIDKIESQNIVRMSSTIGTLVPFHSSSVGKAYLAAMQEKERNELMAEIAYPQITRFTKTEPKDVLNEVLISAKQNYNFDDQENEEGIVCFGAAIVNQQQLPIAAISVSVPLFRLSDHSDYTIPLLRCAANISSEMQLS